MTREKLAALYWEKYQDAALHRASTDVGEYDELNEWDQEAQKDALEAVQLAIWEERTNA